ncbi:MAG: C10 family peptidase [Bacteroidales bacterium]|nr:C10 family peptidase [Bacteroidales bacterium]
MKKLLSLVWLLLCSLPLYSAPVSVEQARKIALDYLTRQAGTLPGLNRTPGKQPELSLAYSPTLPARVAAPGTSMPEQQALLYVFNDQTAGGFVVVAGDDRANAVLAVTGQGSFDPALLHPGMQWWLHEAEASMARLIADNNRQRTMVIRAEGLAASVDPLLTTQWGQGEPYNNLCPTDPTHGGRSVTGCTATALAQILKYHKYPAKGSDKVSYSTPTHGLSISADLSTFTFDWANMADNYSTTSTTSEQQAAVAKLMYACGVACKMDYCSLGSGSSALPAIVEQYFGIDKACTAHEREYFTTNEWNEIVMTELNAHRPVLYSGASQEGGHAFVCDGYNAENLYHINWGWDGLCDGYFDLITLDADRNGDPDRSTDYSSSYGMGQRILVGIQPNKGNANVSDELFLGGQLTVSATKVTRSGQFTVTATNLNAGLEDFATDGLVGVGYYDAADNLCATDILYQLSGGLSVYAYYPTLNFSDRTVPNTLANGTYTLRVICGASAENMHPVRCAVGTGLPTELVVTVTDASVTFSNPADLAYNLSLTSTTLPEGGTAPGGQAAMSFTIHNSGSLYQGEIALVRVIGEDKYWVCRSNMIVEAGSDFVFSPSVRMPEELGTDHLQLVYYDHLAGGYVTLADCYPVVKGYKLAALPVTVLTPTVAKDLSGDQPKIRLTLHNEGNDTFQQGHVYAIIPAGGSNYAYDLGTFTIAAGETRTWVKSISLNYNGSPYEGGTYYVYPYNAETNQYISHTNEASFTVGTQGSLTVATTEGYATCCLQHPFKVPNGMECGVVTNASNETLAIDYCYGAGSTVPAGTPVIVKAELGSYTYDIDFDNESDAPFGNLLRGSYNDNGYCYAGEGTWKYYMLSYNTAGTNLGFYYGTADGAPFLNGPARAYLAVPADEAYAMGYNLTDGMATGCTPALQQAGQPDAAFTIDGRRVTGNVKQLPHGLYIINGKKVMR